MAINEPPSATWNITARRTDSLSRQDSVFCKNGFKIKKKQQRGADNKIDGARRGKYWGFAEVCSYFE